ncbi:hypothetical protein Esti_002352 [Eimeria stiedai]
MEDKDKLQQLLRKLLGPSSAGFLWCRQKSWEVMESEVDSHEELLQSPSQVSVQQAQDLQTQEQDEDCNEAKVELEPKRPLRSYSTRPSPPRLSSSSSVEQPYSTVAAKAKDPTSASPEGAQGKADFHPLAFLKLRIKGKPVIALLDTGYTPILISSDLADELQLTTHRIERPARMLLGNGDKMVMNEMTKGLKCKAGELYFKLNAWLAHMPFALLLAQRSMHQKRLMRRFGPSKLTDWRGGRRLVLPLTEEKPETRTAVPKKDRLWKDREVMQAAHELLEKALKELSREEAEAMVRPSSKRYKNFKAGAPNAHAGRIAIAAREQAEGNLHVWGQEANVEAPEDTARRGDAKGEAPIGRPASPKPRDAATPQTPSTRYDYP